MPALAMATPFSEVAEVGDRPADDDAWLVTNARFKSRRIRKAVHTEVEASAAKSGDHDGTENLSIA
jgi:hypothetical protein